jgi:hypothetical protein
VFQAAFALPSIGGFLYLFSLSFTANAQSLVLQCGHLTLRFCPMFFANAEPEKEAGLNVLEQLGQM